MASCRSHRFEEDIPGMTEIGMADLQPGRHYPRQARLYWSPDARATTAEGPTTTTLGPRSRSGSLGQLSDQGALETNTTDGYIHTVRTQPGDRRDDPAWLAQSPDDHRSRRRRWLLLVRTGTQGSRSSFMTRSNNLSPGGRGGPPRASRRSTMCWRQFGSIASCANSPTAYSRWAGLFATSCAIRPTVATSVPATRTS